MSSQHSTTENNPQEDKALHANLQTNTKVEDNVIKVEDDVIKVENDVREFLLYAIHSVQPSPAPDEMQIMPPSVNPGTSTDNCDRGVQTETSEPQRNSDCDSLSTTVLPERSLSRTQDPILTLCPQLLEYFESMKATIRNGQRETSETVRKEIFMQMKEAVAVMKEGNDNTKSEKSQLSEVTTKLCNVARSWTRSTNIKKLEIQVTQLQNDAQTLENQKMQVEDHNEELLAKNKELQARLKQTEAEFTRFRHAVGPSANSSKTSDSVIQCEWKQLHFKIYNLSHSLGQHTPSTYSLGEDTRFLLRDVIFSYQSYLECPQERALILQACLWRAIHPESGFESKIWGTQCTSDFKSFRRTYTSANMQSEESLKQTSQWFAQGWNLMAKWALDPYAKQRFVEYGMECLGSFIPNQLKSHRRVETDLGEIFESVRALENYFGSSKAIFKARWFADERSPAFKYHDKLMESINTEATTDTRVTYIVSPMLIKMGNADGNNYTTQIILEKAKVVCK